MSRMNVKEETNSSQQGKIDVKITFDESMHQLRQTPFGTIIDMDECITTGDPGGPLLPSKILRIATPPLTSPNMVSGQQLRTTILSQEPIFLAPIQLRRPGISKGVSHSNDKAPIQNEKLNVKPSAIRPIAEEPFIEPYPAPPFISPKPELYNVATERPVVRLIATEGFGLLPIAVIEVNPFRLLKNGSLEFYPEIYVSLRYQSMNSQLTLGKYLDYETILPDIIITSVAQARRIIKFARTQVVNPSAITDFSNFFPVLNTGVDYVIITDNHSWDEKSIKSKTDLDGDLVSIFQRLADWKEMRGMKARVVTVTDFVNGTYGKFTTGARDLQEVIRIAFYYTLVKS